MKTCLIVLLALFTSTFSVNYVNVFPETDLTSALKTELLQGEINRLNSLRTLHGVGNVTENSTLTNAAQAYADNLCSTDGFQHSPGALSGLYGENLYYTAAYPYIQYSYGAATNSWYSEISDYNFTTQAAVSSNKVVGHFTAEIWKSVTTVGFGYCKTSFVFPGLPLPAVKLYVVGNYYPVPNFYIQGLDKSIDYRYRAYKENVLPPSS